MELFAHEDAVGRMLCRHDTLSEAEHAYAISHGFDSWPAFRVHLFREAHDSRDEPVVSAAEAIHAADHSALAAVLDEHPDVLELATPDGNPLLSVAVGLREVEIVEHLIAAGADVHRPDVCGCTPLHRAAYGHPPEPNPGPQEIHARIIDVLVKNGARVETSSHGDGGTPLLMALFWGHAALADKVAAIDIVPRNLRTAAGLGDLDALTGFFDGDQLRDDAGSARAFYRPHDGFPAWEPGDETQEILDEAFIYAVQNGRLAAAEMLLARGAHVDGAPYTGTALHRVANRGPYDALCFLLDRGADPNATWNVPRGSTPLHLAALQGRLASVRALLDHGGDPEATDNAFSTTPRGYAEWAGQDHIVALFAERE